MADLAERPTAERSRTPLLTLITLESLDRDYQVVASRRGPDHPETAGSRTAVVVVLAAFALLVSVAAVQTSRNADIDNASRSSLIDRIVSRRDLVASLQEQIADLRRRNSAAEGRLRTLGQELSSLRARRTDLAALTGFERVTGDGVRVTLDNPTFADDTTQLRDSDLALLVDGLWAAGAEAIAINGQRLTAMTAIRNSGAAIEVNGVGVAPPFNVVAIGDPRSLAADFLETSSGQAFIGLAQQFGFRYETDSVEDVRLQAAPASMRALRSAQVSTGSPNGKGGRTP